MAESRRKSKPRVEEPLDQDDKPHNWWMTAFYLVCAVGVILIMVLVSNFLSNSDGIQPWLYYSLGGVAVVAGLLWLAGWMANRKA